MQINPCSLFRCFFTEVNPSEQLGKELHKKLSNECMISYSDYQQMNYDPELGGRKLSVKFPASILENSVQVNGPYSVARIEANCVIEAVVKINFGIPDLCDCTIDNKFAFFFRSLSQGYLKWEFFVCASIDTIKNVLVLDSSQEKHIQEICRLANDYLNKN